MDILNFAHSYSPWNIKLVYNIKFIVEINKEYKMIARISSTVSIWNITYTSINASTTIIMQYKLYNKLIHISEREDSAKWTLPIPN